MSRNHHLILPAVLLLAACSLEEPRESFVSPTDFFQTRPQCVAALNGCYYPLKNIYTMLMLIATEGVTDLASIQSSQLDCQLDISPAHPRFGTTVWQYGYVGVRNACCAVDGIRRSPLEDDVRLPLEAEGRIMRAYYYYILTCFFGDVPFYEDYIDSVEDLKRIAALPRMSAVETRDALIAELQEYVPYLPQVRTCEVEDYRAGAAMGWMLIAKMAMWNHRWETALEALGHLEDLYGDLSQYPLSDIPLRNKNTPESIFEIQHDYQVNGIDFHSNCASICMPYRRTAGTAVYDGVEIPELGDEATAWQPLRPNPYLYNILMPRSSSDRRKDMTLVWEWNGHEFSRNWLGPKFWCPGLLQSNDSNNYKIFRYADAVLMTAECHAELGNTAEAVRYLNRVRDRAGIEPASGTLGKVQLDLEIRKERARELFGEFQRKWDLVRWGIWYRQTYEYTAYSNLRNRMKPCHEYYPIPDVEVLASGGALDNKEYEKYGL